MPADAKLDIKGFSCDANDNCKATEKTQDGKEVTKSCVGNKCQTCTVGKDGKKSCKKVNRGKVEQFKAALKNGYTKAKALAVKGWTKAKKAAGYAWDKVKGWFKSGAEQGFAVAAAVAITSALMF